MPDKCVLLCDSHEDIRTICKLILNDYRVEAIPNCENLFENIKSINPDIILMDLWMPWLDGKIVAQSLRENDQTKHIPLVLFSTANDIEKLAIQIKATSFIKKPFDIYDLRETIKKHIK